MLGLILVRLPILVLILSLFQFAAHANGQGDEEGSSCSAEIAPFAGVDHFEFTSPEGSDEPVVEGPYVLGEA
ncbi:MAG: hypothetical protein AAF202_14345, partial [Pseudomonadota bacterium]